jgi:hypothetical protein
VARKQRSKGRGPGGEQAQGAVAQPRPQGTGGGGGGGWGPLRDSIRRDVEQAVTSLAFAERLHQKLDTQRRVFLDFPRAMEQLRSGAIERVAVSLSRLYEGGQGFDLQRFLRDLPTALAHLAAADRSKSIPPPPAAETSPAAPATAAAEPAASSEANASSSETSTPEATPSPAPSPEGTPSAPSTPESSTGPGSAVSPRLELRSKLLGAAPQLAKAAASYRRNVATVKRAALPRRSPGPWRADREVLEEARRAVEFVQKLYDAYAEAWADQPLPPNLAEQTAAELDRFLAWTQLDRYVELAVLASTNAPRPPKPGQQVFGSRESAPPPVTEASPGAVAASAEPAPVTEASPPPAETSAEEGAPKSDTDQPAATD